MFIRDDPNLAAGNRQHDVLSDNAGVAFIIRVHGNRHIGQHRFGAGGRNLDIIASVGQRDAVFQRVFEMPETALDILRLDLEIADRGFQLGVPVDQPFVAVNQLVIIQIDEDLEHGFAEMRVHGELFAAPVHRTAEAAQLGGDGAAAFAFPVPDFLDEFLARIIGAFVLLRFQLAFDHHLRRDAGMVGADHPQRILAAQTFVPDHDILQGVVQRMADMQGPGHVGRRVHDGEGLRIGALGPEKALFFPVLVPTLLDGSRIECLGEFGGHSDRPLPATTGARNGLYGESFRRIAPSYE